MVVIFKFVKNVDRRGDGVGRWRRRDVRSLARLGIWRGPNSEIAHARGDVDLPPVADVDGHAHPDAIHVHDAEQRVACSYGLARRGIRVCRTPAAGAAIVREVSCPAFSSSSIVAKKLVACGPQFFGLLRQS